MEEGFLGSPVQVAEGTLMALEAIHSYKNQVLGHKDVPKLKLFWPLRLFLVRGISGRQHCNR